MTVKIQIRRGTAAQWTSANPTLLSGEQGLETDTGKTKIGDGVTAWNSLGYAFVPNSLISASKGALITSTGSAVDDLTVGTDGHVLTADSNETLGIKWAAPAGGLPTQTSQAGKLLTTNGTAASWVDPPTNRNFLYNGAMQVHQRGTSVTGITSGGYRTADRWYQTVSSLGTWTQSVESDGPTGSGLAKSLKILCTTAAASPGASGVVILNQLLEGQDLQRVKKGTASAEQLTLSFWVKSNVTGTYVVTMKDSDNNRHVSGTYTISASATWEKKTITFPADTTGAFANDNGESMDLEFYLAAGSNYTSGTLPSTWASVTTANRAVGQTNLAAATNNYWQITGVQLETGPVATPFEFEPYEATLRKCQRYYYLFTSGATKFVSVGTYYLTTQIVGGVFFPVTMRTAPSLVSTTGTDYYRMFVNATSDLFNDLSIAAAHTNAAQVSVNTNVSGTAGQSGSIQTNDAAASLAFSAEL